MGEETLRGPDDGTGSGGSPSWVLGAKRSGGWKETAELWALWGPELVLRWELQPPPSLEQLQPGVSLSCQKGPSLGTGQCLGEVVWFQLRSGE